MSLVGRIHDHLHPSSDVDESVSAPAWVRHYDSLVRVMSLGRTDRLHGATLALAGLGPDQAVLDVGCGTGDLVLLAEATVDGRGTFAGIDTEPGMIAQAKGKRAERGSAAVFAESGIESVPHPDESFDIITSSLMFHHLTTEQQAAGLLECHRLLKPGGSLIIVDINSARRSVVSRFPGHRDLDEGDTAQNELPRQLSEAGFEDIETGAHPLKALSYAKATKP